MSYVIGSGCSTCHYCFRTCPVDAIRFVDKVYAVDEEKCISCGACAKVCPSGIIYDPEACSEEAVVEADADSYDLIVLGAGGAGLVAAVRFKELTGRSVVVFEKGKKVGGNTMLAHNFLTRYSKWHEKAGMPDLREEAIKSIVQGDRDLSESLLRKAMYAQTDALNWMLDMGGLDDLMTLVDIRPRGNRMGPFVHTPGFLDFPHRIENETSTDHSMGPGWMGTYVIRTMMKRCEELGIEVLTEHRALSLNVDKSGKFVSAVIGNPYGETEVFGKCCLVATGGFARNEEVMKGILPEFYEGEPVHTFTVASNTGDAIAMAKDIGAMMDFEHVKIPMFGPVHHPYSFPVLRLSGNPRAVMVSLEGRRFQDEGKPPEMALKGPLEELPQKVAYAVFDSKSKEIMGKELLDQCRSDEGMYQCMVHWRDELEYETTLGKPVCKADTLEALAEKTGMDPVAFAEEMEKYNRFCKSGSDLDFGKNAEFLAPVEAGPFYAVFLSRFNEGAEGGIVNDEALHIVREDGASFEGLYVAGDCCRGVLKTSDEGGKLGEFPWAMASGFMVAEEAAKTFLNEYEGIQSSDYSANLDTGVKN